MYNYPRNFTAAHDYFLQLANLNGNGTAQHHLALIYSIGLGGIPKDPARAILYHTYAAVSGSIASEMILAYRYLYGLSVTKSCEESAWYYRQVADHGMRVYFAGPPGGKMLPKADTKLSDEVGGVYGYDAQPEATLEDLLDYFRFSARKGDQHANLVLGQVYYVGTSSIPRDLRKARDYFIEATKDVFNSDGTLKQSIDGKRPVVDAGNLEAAGKAAAYLGRIYWRGEEVSIRQDNATARRWYLRAAEQGVADGFNGLGEMYLHGANGVKDLIKAEHFFFKAAEAKNFEAQTNLGLLYYGTLLTVFS